MDMQWVKSDLIWQLFFGFIGIAGVIYTIKAYYKNGATLSQRAIGKTVNQAGRDISTRGH